MLQLVGDMTGVSKQTMLQIWYKRKTSSIYSTIARAGLMSHLMKPLWPSKYA